MFMYIFFAVCFITCIAAIYFQLKEPKLYILFFKESSTQIIIGYFYNKKELYEYIKKATILVPRAAGCFSISEGFSAWTEEVLKEQLTEHFHLIDFQKETNFCDRK